MFHGVALSWHEYSCTLRMQVDAGHSQQPSSDVEKIAVQSGQPGSCTPEAPQSESVPTTLATHLREAIAEEPGSQAANKTRQGKPAGKLMGSKVRDGGHENFVRMASKKGRSSFTFKSKSGSSNKNPKNRKWASRKMAAESLPVAGLGADSTKEASLVRRASASFYYFLITLLNAGILPS